MKKRMGTAGGSKQEQRSAPIERRLPIGRLLAFVSPSLVGKWTRHDRLHLKQESNRI